MISPLSKVFGGLRVFCGRKLPAAVAAAILISAAIPRPVSAACPDFAVAQSYGAGANPSSVAVGDFNGDGKSDLVVANQGSSNVSILLGNGNGTFAAAVNYAASAGPRFVAVGDFNGDGKSDLAVANSGSNDVSILLGTGSGTFTAAVNYAVGMVPLSVAVGDFNGDGKSDLAVASFNSNAVSILLGNGTGTFAAAVNYGVGANPHSVAVADFNVDLKSDLAVANYGSHNVSILLGNGTGTFPAAVNYAVSTNPLGVAAGDFNGDGKSDLAVANYLANNISILLGNGNGTFATPVSYGAGATPRSIAVGDFNGDASSDLAVANSDNSNTVSVLVGNTSGAFAAPVSYAVGTNPYSVAVGDFNGDGRSDLAVANLGSNAVSILLNSCVPLVTITSVSPSTGPTGGGQSVTISGTNLSGATSVTFGSLAATITASTATSISVITPAHAAGAVDVVVTTPAGSATSTGGYTYTTGTVTLTGTILTIVGGGTDDGRLATDAALNEPSDVAIDSSGNIYISEYRGNRIRKVAAGSGIISTIAGNGSAAFVGDGGPATAAQLWLPEAVAIDKSGNLLIADLQNHRLRKIDIVTGVISTIHQTGGNTESVAVDGAGNIYVGDPFGVQKVTPSGTVTPVVAAVGAYGMDMAVDPAGTVLYIADPNANVVRKVDLSGTSAVAVGTGARGSSGDGGPASAATLSSPAGLALDSSGALFISDYGNGRIRRVDGQTNIITTYAAIGNPGGLTLDGANNLYVATNIQIYLGGNVAADSNRVFVVNAATRAVAAVAGSGLVGDGSIGTAVALDTPNSVAQDSSGDLYIADTSHHRIRKWSRSTAIISTVAGTGRPGFSGDGGPATAAQLQQPRGVAYDAPRNDLYIADQANNVIRKMNLTSGVITTVAGNGSAGVGGDNGPATAASLYAPYGVAVDVSGTLYIADFGNRRIRKVTNGVITTLAGGWTPHGIAADSSGNVYIADSDAGLIRRVDALTGAVSSFGAGITPLGVALDASRNLFIAGRQAIRKVDAATQITTTIAGTGPAPEVAGSFEGDGGPATSARLNNPWGVMVDANGNLFIADTGSNRIRAMMACQAVGAPTLLAPANGAVGVSTAPALSWSKVDHAFRYDVYLDTTSPPARIVASDVESTTFVPSNLSPSTQYYWQATAKGDPFCSSISKTPSSIASFTTAAACGAGPFDVISPPDGATSLSSPLQLSWQASPGAGSYDVYYGSANPPPLVFSNLNQTTLTVDLPGLNYWFIVAHAACDPNKTAATPVRSFTTTRSPGCTPGQIQVAPLSPPNGAIGVTTSAQLSWTSSGVVSTYDLNFGTSQTPPLFAANLTAQTQTIPTLAPGTTYYWRIVAKGPCDPNGIPSAIVSFTTQTCEVPGATSILFAPATVSAGATYTIVWSVTANLDPDGGYLVERSSSIDFSTIIDSQVTSSTAASFVAAEARLYYHRVRAVSGCDPTKSGAISTVMTTMAVTARPNVIFTVQPKAVITSLGPPADLLENQRSSFTIENIGTETMTVSITRNELAGSQSFFTIVDPLGQDLLFIPLEPRKPRTFVIRYSGPPKDVAASYMGVIVITAARQEVVPYAFVNLKVGGGNAAIPQFSVCDMPSQCTPTDYLALAGYRDEAARPIDRRLTITNTGSTPMDLAAEIGPEVWLVLESGWNSEPLLPNSSRSIGLFTKRNRAPKPTLPRYTYFTVRTKDGASARVLVQDNDQLTIVSGRASLLDVGARSFIVPEVLSRLSVRGNPLVTRLRLSNVGSDEVQAELIFTPAGSDGFDPAVKRATVIVPPNDVVSLIDPIVQVFRLTRPASGQIEVRISRERLGLIGVTSSVMALGTGGGFGFAVPTVNRGEGAGLASPHVLLGVTANANVTTALTLAETTGTDKASVRVTLFDASGIRVGVDRLIDVPRYGYTHMDNVVSALGGTTLDGGRIELRVESGGGSVIALGEVTAVGSDSGATIVSEPISPASTSSAVARAYLKTRPYATTANVTTVIPIVASAAGAAPAYSTAVTLSAPAALQGIFKAVFRPADAAPLTQTVTVPAGSTRNFADVLRELFGLTQSAQGGLFVESPPGGIVKAVLQSTSSPGASPLPVSAYSLPTTLSEVLASFSSSAQRPLFYDGLDQSVDPSQGSKWSLLLNEVAGASGNFEIRLYEAGNRSVPINDRYVVPIQPYEQKKLDVFRELGLDSADRRKDRTNVQVVVTATAGAARVAAQTMSIDQSGNTQVHPLTPSVGSGVSRVGPVVVVGLQTTTTTVASSALTSTYKQSVTFTATVAPSAATGTVSFVDGPTTFGTGVLSSGMAPFSKPDLSAGTHSITAVYGGDASFGSSTSAPIMQTVNKASTTTTVTSSSNSSATGEAVTFTATVAPSSATGTVTFTDGSTTLGTGTLSSGTATYTTSSLTAGTHSITASYGGDANYLTSTSTAVQQTVSPSVTSTITTVTSSSSISTFGQLVTFTATVSPSAATGTVTFKDGTTTLGPGTLSNGTATFPTSSLAVGTHSITAVYGGDSAYSGSTSAALAQTVNKASTSTTLSSSANPSSFGQSVTFTATVSPSTATGTVNFLDGSTTLGPGTLSAGTATFSTSSLTAGAHSVTASYGGDANYATSTSAALTQTVNKASTMAALNSSANPSSTSQSVTFTASVTPSGATGSITFLDGATTLATVMLSSGSAPFTTSLLTAGTHSITASYSGDTNYATSTSAALTQTVNKASTTTTVSASANPSAVGQSVTFTGTVTPSAATGTVTFMDGATTLGTGTLSSGIATFSTPSLTAGTHSITASYGGDANYLTSTSAALQQTVSASLTSTTTTVTSSSSTTTFGQAVTFTASVSPSSATGTITFKDGTTTLGTRALSSGTAAFSTSSLTVGTHSITAAYGGDSTYVGSTSAAIIQRVNAAPGAPTVAAVSPNVGSASGGTTVTVTGTGFQSGATLTIGGSAATNVTFVSATSLTARTPSHAVGVVDVTVTNPGGLSATLTGGFTYKPSGDANGDNQVAVADVIYLINGLFAGGPSAVAGDANGDGQVTVADIFYLINYLFTNGPAPR